MRDYNMLLKYLGVRVRLVFQLTVSQHIRLGVELSRAHDCFVFTAGIVLSLGALLVHFWV
jgi:hypothetical protein